MDGIIYDPRISLRVASLEEQKYERVTPVARPHAEPTTCGNIVTFTSPPVCKSGEMWLFRKGPDLTVSQPESDQLLCMSCGKQERSR